MVELLSLKIKNRMKNILCLLATLLIVANATAQTDAMFPELQLFDKYCAYFALDEVPAVRADTNLIAIWKMKEDTDPHNYFVLERAAANEFVFTYMNRGGSNRTYENVRAFFSKVGDADFLNVSCYDRQSGRSRYFFLKVTDAEKHGRNLEVQLLADATLKDLTSREALRKRIAENVNNPGYYKSPVHFRKILPLLYCK